MQSLTITSSWLKTMSELDLIPEIEYLKEIREQLFRNAYQLPTKILEFKPNSS